MMIKWLKRLWERPGRMVRRREAEERRCMVQTQRYQAVAGGRAMGRSYTQASTALQGMTFTSTTYDEAGSLTQADLTRAYEAMQQSQPREPQMVAQVRMIEEMKTQHSCREGKEPWVG